MIVLAVALPLLGAFLLPILARTWLPLARIAGLSIMALVAVIAAQTWLGLGANAQTIALGGFAPPLGILFYVDDLALLFTFATALLTLLLWPRAEGEAGIREQSLTLVLAAGAAGLALSGDLFNLYVFYELVAVASYGLAAARQTAPGFAATFRYLMISAFGSVLALVGIAMIYFATGTLNLADLARIAPGQLNGPEALAAFMCLLTGFGVKAELFPVNAWVPEVYATASRRVSGLLAGLISKLAVLVIVRLLVLVFPQEEARQVMLVLGILSVFSGELAAWRARDLTRMLAWSSIGQLGIILIAFALPGHTGIIVGVAAAVHHLVIKPALFLLAERWGGRISALKGAARISPLGGGLFVLFALSLIGVPPLPGFWIKYLLLSGLAEQGGGWHILAAVTILVTTVIEASYLFRVAGILFNRKPGHDTPRTHRFADLATATLFGALLIAGAATAGTLGKQLEALASRAADPGYYIQQVFGGNDPS